LLYRHVSILHVITMFRTPAIYNEKTRDLTQRGISVPSVSQVLTVDMLMLLKAEDWKIQNGLVYGSMMLIASVMTIRQLFAKCLHPQF
jgi:hypothetical protein